MKLSRRDLLRIGSAATGALAAAQALGCTPGPQAPPPATPGAPPAPPPAAAGAAGPDWSAIRAEFELTDEYVHLACLLISSHPRVVREAIEEHRRALDVNPAVYVHRRWAWKAEDIDEDGEERAARAAARYLETEPDLIALTDSTTMGLAMVYNGVLIRPDQEILSTEHEHFATRGSLALRSRRTGCPVRTIRLYDHEGAAAVTADGLVRALIDQIRPETRVVAVTWVHSTTGVKLPIRRMAEEIAARNQGRSPEDRILFCVDGAHGLGVEDATIADLGCDFLMAGCHKWLFGPRGTGIIWGAPHAWEQCLPTIPTFSYVARKTPGRLMTPGGFHSFEHRWALPAAFDFHLGIGKAHVQARTRALAGQLKRGLAGIPGLTLLTPMSDELSAGIVVFQLPGKTAEDTERALFARNVIASTTPHKPPDPRLTPGMFNTPEEIERAIAAVRAVAAS